jgi:hypothetical protein
MDLTTTAAVVGIVAAVVYVAETAYKCGSALLKKITAGHVLEKVTHLCFAPYSQPACRMNPGAKTVRLVDTYS